jgi:hypothetical protein
MNEVWKEVVMACFKVQLQHLFEGPEENHRKLYSIYLASRLRIESGSSKYEAGMKITTLQCLV